MRQQTEAPGARVSCLMAADGRGEVPGGRGDASGKVFVKRTVTGLACVAGALRATDKPAQVLGGAARGAGGGAGGARAGRRGVRGEGDCGSSEDAEVEEGGRPPHAGAPK